MSQLRIRIRLFNWIWSGYLDGSGSILGSNDSFSNLYTSCLNYRCIHTRREYPDLFWKPESGRIHQNPVFLEVRIRIGFFSNSQFWNSRSDLENLVYAYPTPELNWKRLNIKKHFSMVYISMLFSFLFLGSKLFRQMSKLISNVIAYFPSCKMIWLMVLI